MALSSRERSISIAVIAAVGLLVFDWIILSPYLDWRADVAQQANAHAAMLDKARHTLDREKQLRTLLADMSGSIKSDESAAEAQLLHLIHDWEQQAGVKNPSFQRIRSTEQPGFSQLTFHLAGAGPMNAVAMLLYRAETAAIPIRIDDIQIAPKRDNADDLQIQLTLSTLCHRNNADHPGRQNSIQVAGGF